MTAHPADLQERAGGRIARVAPWASVIAWTMARPSPARWPAPDTIYTEVDPQSDPTAVFSLTYRIYVPADPESIT